VRSNYGILVRKKGSEVEVTTSFAAHRKVPHVEAVPHSIECICHTIWAAMGFGFVVMVRDRSYTSLDRCVANCKAGLILELSEEYKGQRRIIYEIRGLRYHSRVKN